MGKKTPEREFDLLIVNGIVFDGRGVPGVPADLAVKGDRIVRISPSLRLSRAKRVIDAKGRAVAPNW